MNRLRNSFVLAPCAFSIRPSRFRQDRPTAHRRHRGKGRWASTGRAQLASATVLNARARTPRLGSDVRRLGACGEPVIAERRRQLRHRDGTSRSSARRNDCRFGIAKPEISAMVSFNFQRRVRSMRAHIDNPRSFSQEAGEANGTGAEYLRADLSPRDSGAQTKQLLTKYRDLRVVSCENDDALKSGRDATSQTERWTARRPARKEGPPNIDELSRQARVRAKIVRLPSQTSCSAATVTPRTQLPIKSSGHWRTTDFA